MKIKIIKRIDGNKPAAAEKKKEDKKKKPSVESTVQTWITERRENVETEDRSRNANFARWSTDVVSVEPV